MASVDIEEGYCVYVMTAGRDELVTEGSVN